MCQANSVGVVEIRAWMIAGVRPLSVDLYAVPHVVVANGLTRNFTDDSFAGELRGKQF